MSNWIDIKDSLPEEFCNVLVIVESRIITGGYYAYSTWWPASVNGVLFSGEVTHWMEIPKELLNG